MKKLLFTLLLLIPFCIQAQNKENTDISKYLSGAVPVVDGKVVFSKEINAPGLSKEQIYNIGLEWMDRTLKENNNKSGIVFKNEADGVIAGISEHYIVFKSTAFSLDRTTITYRIILTALNNKCDIEVSAIKYLYNGTQSNTPDRYSAEEWITDDIAINKAGTKLSYVSGKFRTKTIDKVDELVESLKKDLESNIIKMAQSQTSASAQTTPVSPAVVQPATVTTVTSANPVAAATSYTNTTSAKVTNTISNTPMEGYKNIAPDKIPGNIIKMLSQDWMLITAGNSAKFNTMTASWGGLGVLYNKPVAICFINPARYTYQLMESGDTYTLTFYTETYRDALNYCGSVSGKDTDKIKGSGLTPITTPQGSMAFSQAWMIIECRKLVSQSISLDAINNAAEKEKRGAQPMHKMYIGEILNVWVK